MDRCTGRHCRPVLQLPTGQSCSLQTLVFMDDPGAHGKNRGKQSKTTERGKANLNGARTCEGQWAWQAKRSRQTQPAEQSHCRRTQPADPPSGTGLITNGHRWPASQQTTAADDDVGLSLAVQCRQVGGVQWYSGRRAQTYLTCPYPT